VTSYISVKKCVQFKFSEIFFEHDLKKIVQMHSSIMKNKPFALFKCSFSYFYFDVFFYSWFDLLTNEVDFTLTRSLRLICVRNTLQKICFIDPKVNPKKEI
jgi:hypothetical protein